MTVELTQVRVLIGHHTNQEERRGSLCWDNTHTQEGYISQESEHLTHTHTHSHTHTSSSSTMAFSNLSACSSDLSYSSRICLPGSCDSCTGSSWEVDNCPESCCEPPCCAPR